MSVDVVEDEIMLKIALNVFFCFFGARHEPKGNYIVSCYYSFLFIISFESEKLS